MSDKQYSDIASGLNDVVLVHPHKSPETSAVHEFISLARAAGANPVAQLFAPLREFNPRTLIGAGKLEDLKDAVCQYGVDLVFIDHALSPIQERNLQNELGCRVLDRTGLILDVFACRARSFEGKLQVELAQMRHLSTRLVRGWTHLERQKGGIGLRGPGETQLETDRRLVQKRIRVLKDRLDKLERQRHQQKQSRRRNQHPVVALVGYTNAGKSTLFNALTGLDRAYVADQLFATLDTMVRAIKLHGGASVLLSDTVGFIHGLPHDLVAAFHATLEEVRDADLLLHVVDVSDSEFWDHIEDVNTVLEQIGASKQRLLVFNKVDQLSSIPRAKDPASPCVVPSGIYVSARDGWGMHELEQEIQRRLCGSAVVCRVHLGLDQGALRSHIYHSGKVLSDHPVDDGWDMQVELMPKLFQQLNEQHVLG